MSSTDGRGDEHELDAALIAVLPDGHPSTSLAVMSLAISTTPDVLNPMANYAPIDGSGTSPPLSIASHLRRRH
jgi:hypothetical protein